MPHCKIAPSKAAQWVHCPASIKMQEQFPREGESLAAKEGTLAHKFAAHVLREELIPAELDVTFEIADAANIYIDDVRSFEIQELHVEEYIHCSKIHSMSFGTCDCWGVLNDRLIIWDFKYGILPISAIKNYQLLHYASGIMSKIESPKDIRVIEFRIIQPRAIRPVCVSNWVLKTHEVGFYENQLRAAAVEALGEKPSTVPGNCCRYCSARHVCNALQNECARISDNTYAYSVPLELEASSLSKELLNLQKAAEMLKYRVTALEAQALKMIQEGKLVPEFSIRQTFSREKWGYSVVDIIATGDLCGFDLRKPLEAITPAEARKKGLTKEFVSKFTKKEQSGYKLVRDDNYKIREVFKHD